MGKDIRNWLYLSCFIDLFGVSCIVPMLGLHLRSLGFSHSLVGLLSSAYSTIQFVAGPVVGSWSDFYGRKTVLYLTLFACSLAYCVLGVASTFAVVLSVRIVLGLMKHTQTICKTLVADVIPADKQGEVQGKLNGVAGLGFMVGPVVGGHIAELENGFQYMCYTTSAMFFLNSLIVFFSFPATELKLQETKGECKSDKNSDNVGKEKKQNLSLIVTDLFNVDWKNFWDVFILKFILGIGLSVFFSNYYLFVEETFKISPKYIGYTISFQGLISAASGILIKFFNRFYNDNSISFDFLKIFHCFLILSLSFLAIFLSTNLYLFLICLLPLSSATSLIRIITTELLLLRSDVNHRGSLMGASNSVSSSTRMVAPILTGFVQDIFHPSHIILIAFVISLCGTLISFFLKSHCKNVTEKKPFKIS